MDYDHDPLADIAAPNCRRCLVPTTDVGDVREVAAADTSIVMGSADTAAPPAGWTPSPDVGGPLHHAGLEHLYTKEGWPLRRDCLRLFNSSGVEVARLRDDRAYGSDGRYVGTIVNERLVYRPMHSGRTASSFSPSHRMGFSRMRRMARGMSGSEPPFEH